MRFRTSVGCDLVLVFLTRTGPFAHSHPRLHSACGPYWSVRIWQAPFSFGILILWPRTSIWLLADQDPGYALQQRESPQV